MFALPALFAAVPGLHRCDCCGGVYRLRQVLPPGTAGRIICHACAGFEPDEGPRPRRPRPTD